MMNLSQPSGWNDIAMGSELTGLRTEMHAGFSEVRGEMHAGFAELRGEMHAAHSELLLKLFFGMVASNATLVGLVFAAVRLG
jgi:hypothetical protein